MAERITVALAQRVGSGTAFPGSPATNDMFFRTDLSLWCYYDGTRWLTQTLYTYNSYRDAQSGNDVQGRFVPVSSYDSWFVDWEISYFVLGTNNGSNYWTFDLRKTTAANAFTSIDSFNSSAASGSVWNLSQRTLGVALGGSATYKEFQVWSTPTGGPGVVYVSHMIRYRLIVT